jgi:DNA-directed RNA polymerase alpha subunit
MVPSVNDARSVMISLKPTERRIQSVNNVKKRMKMKMKMFNATKDEDQISKLNSRVTDLHEAYRVLLQNVNKLQKEFGKEYTYDKLEVELYKHENKLSEVNETVGDNYRETDERLNKLEENLMKLSDKTLADVKEEATSTNPGEVYLQAKDKVLAAMDYLLDTDVGHFEFSSRAMNCFWVRHITTMRNLISFSEKTLLKTKNLGRQTLNEIKSVLAKYDLKLREEDCLDELNEEAQRLHP